ncbi:hypothetical protein JW962_00960 [Candidatus Dojkabacteria bacterium]|nr:hypothetical protein [Candidatus Dojkabacteria bacterium]
MTAYTGLVLIILAWLLQLMSNEKTMNKGFLLVYIFGVAVLVYDGLNAGVTTMGLLNLISGILAAIVFMRIRKR